MAGFDNEEARSDKRSIEDYIKMRQKDGTAAALYNVLTLAILSTGYSIRPDPADTNEEQVELVRRNLQEPPHKGGMEIPLSLLLADQLRAVLEGFRLYEKVWMVQDGRLVYKKLASRESTTVTLLRADDGGYGGAKQQTIFKGKNIEVTLPAWKTLLFTYGKDKDYLYGESAFKAAYYHFDKKHRAYYLQELSAQARAIPPILGGPEPGDAADETEAKKRALMTALGKFGRIKPVLYRPKGYAVDTLDLGKGAMDLMPYIDHHDTQMARSILAQFLMLGTQDKSVGSWALSENHSDIFLLSVKAIMNNVAEHWNYYVIPDLHDLNFATPLYSELKFDDITSDVRDLIKAVFTELVKKGSINQALQEGIEDRIAQSLEVDQEELEKTREEEAERKAEAAKNPPPPPPPVPEPPKVVSQGDHHGRPLALASGSARLPQQNAALTLHRYSRN